MRKKLFIAGGAIIGVLIIVFLVLPLIQSRLNSSQTKSAFQTESAKQGNLTAYVSATGSVRANQTAQLAWQTSGKVASVKAKEGQTVDNDAVLAELDPTSLSQSIILAQADLTAAQTNLENVMDNSEARAAAQLALIQAQKDLDDAQDESQSKLYQRASQETIDIARANLINANEALDQAEAIYNANSGRGKEDPVYAAALSQYAKARQDQQNAEYNLRYAQELPDPLDVQEVNVKLEQAKAKLLAAKKEWDRIKDGPDPKDIAAAQAKVDAAQATVNTARITAPFAGTITSAISQPGDLVNATSLGFQIDDLSHLLVDVQVSEVDINRVKVGQPVDLTFDAIQDKEYTGKVTKISEVGASDNGAINFTVTVEIISPEKTIKPGMTAAVNVAVDQLQNVLIIPNRAVRTVNEKRVVYVLNNGIPMMKEVTLGVSDGTYSELAGGDIKAGDPIVLNPPSNSIGFGPSMGAGGE